MDIDISQLRQAVKSVLPLTGESYRGAGTGVFINLNNSMWLMTGSFGSKIAGAKVSDEFDEDLLDKYFSVSDLYQYLCASFATENVQIRFDSARSRIVFKIGRNTRSFTYQSVADQGKFVDLPALSDSMTLPDTKILQAVAAAASTEQTSDLSGVWINGESDIEFIALDGYIIAYAKFKNNLTRNFNCLVPADFVNYVGKIYWESYPLMSIKDNKIYIFSDNYFAISTTLYSEKYRGESVAKFYRTIEFYQEAVVDTLDLIDKLGVLTGVDRRDSNVSAVQFNFDDERGDLHLTALSKQENGEAEFFIPASGLTYECTLNGHLAKKAAGLLRNLNSPNLLFSPDDEYNLMFIRPSNSNDIIIGTTLMAF